MGRFESGMFQKRDLLYVHRLCNVSLQRMSYSRVLLLICPAGEKLPQMTTKSTPDIYSTYVPAFELLC